MHSSDKQELDALKNEIKKLKNEMKEKNYELQKLKRDLEAITKKNIDSQSSYITRDPSLLSKHYNYNSASNQKSQVPISSHGSLVIPSAVNRNTLSRQAAFGSYQSSASTRSRPSSAIVIGSSLATDHHMYMTQRSHSEDDNLSNEVKHPLLLCKL